MRNMVSQGAQRLEPSLIRTVLDRAAALRAEAESKVQGQNEAREKSEALGGEIAALQAQKAALEAETLAARQSLRELEDLRQGAASSPYETAGAEALPGLEQLVDQILRRLRV